MSDGAGDDDRCPYPGGWWNLLAEAGPRFDGYLRARDLRDYEVDILLVTAVADAMENIEGYNPNRPFLAWFFGILRNAARNYLATNPRATQLSEVHLLDLVASEEQGAVQPLSGQRGGELPNIAQPLTEIEEKILDAIALAKGGRGNGAWTPALAEETGIKPGTLRQIKKRLLDRLGW
jgi:hypothetical protein